MLHIMSTLAVELAFRDGILPGWGGAPRVDWQPTAILVRRLREGARADVIIAIDDQLRALEAEGILRRGSVTPVARANFGIAVAAGAAHPDISDEPGFLETLRAARSVAYSLSGASGSHLREILHAHGADEVLERATAIPSGYTAERLVDGTADIAVQQISELMMVDGIEVVGPFPGRLQKSTDFSAAIFTGAQDPGAAEAFLSYLGTAAARDAFAAGGLEPFAAQLSVS